MPKINDNKILKFSENIELTVSVHRKARVKTPSKYKINTIVIYKSLVIIFRKISVKH